MIRITTPDGQLKTFSGNYTIEKDIESGRTIRILEGTKPVFDVPEGSKVTVSQMADHPHPKIDPK